MKLKKIGVLGFSIAGLVLTASAAIVPALAQSNQSRSNGTSCPEMRRALTRLQAAQQELSSAPHDYQGHRSQALKATNTAIDQIQQGLQSRDCR